MPFALDEATLASLLVAIVVVLIAETVYLVLAKAKGYRKEVNRRLVLGERQPDRAAVLASLRRERGLTEEGHFTSTITSVNRLILQSGASISVAKFLILAGMASLVLAIAVFVATNGDPAKTLVGLGAGLAIPFLVLSFMRGRRRAAFGLRFPDAVDIIVRSIKAGHPVPVAIAMVARELPDPIGTEFGMVADEVTYGAELEGAIRNLLFRVGQEDLPLFVTAVAIQNSTGGNLAEILSNLSKVIRERYKMRRKIKALSSEGRFSALALTALPIGVFAVVNLSAPNFYGEIWHHPNTQFVLGCAAIWMGLGNLVMMRMVNFKV